MKIIIKNIFILTFFYSYIIIIKKIYNEENEKENTIAVFHYNKCSKSR